MTQSNLAQPLVYIIEFILSGQPRSLAVIPVDAANGVILDAPEGSEFYEGKTVNGGHFKIPIAAVTNVFASWWEVKNKTNQGQGTWHLSDDAIEDYVEASRDKPDRWSEDGTLKDSTGREVTGKDEEPKHGRRIW